MKSLFKNLTKIVIMVLVMGFLASCTEDSNFDDIIENVKESPFLENGDDQDDDYRPPTAG